MNGVYFLKNIVAASSANSSCKFLPPDCGDKRKRRRTAHTPRSLADKKTATSNQVRDILRLDFQAVAKGRLCEWFALRSSPPRRVSSLRSITQQKSGRSSIELERLSLPENR